MRRSTPRAVVRFPVVKASSPRRTSELLLVLRAADIIFSIFRSELPASTPNAQPRTHVRTDQSTTLLPTSSLVTPSQSALRVRKATRCGATSSLCCVPRSCGQGTIARKDGICFHSPFFGTWYTAALVLVFIETSLKARANGAVSVVNRASTEASGRCRDATTDSSESGARVRARAELVAPQFRSLLSSSCRQERDAARQ